MVAACMLAVSPLITETAFASELQMQIMSVQLKSATLKELFDLIQSKSNYSFLIRNNDINLNERVSIEIENKSIDEILTVALKNQKATFEVKDNRIIVYKSAKSAPSQTNKQSKTQSAQQNIKIGGKVVDAATGEPIIGANIIVKGKSIGTSTDVDGNFTLDVPANAQLTVSYIGYFGTEIKAVAGSKLVIRIKEDRQTLGEVVVVGYGVQKKESLTGSMNVVNNTKLKDITTPNVSNMLSGKAPGVYVNSGSGQPGSDAAIVIRGKSTVNGSTDPLWVVDGVIVGSDAGALNPSDIESMSILKDAASTAIYGSQGANGVILITTKKGKAGKTNIDASIKMGVTQLNSGRFKVMDGAQLYDYYKSFSNQEKISFARWNPELRDSNFNWWDNATHLGFAKDYNVSINGGTEKMRTYTSLGYYNEDGAVKGYDFTRYNFRFKVDYAANDWLTIHPQVSASRKDIIDKEHSVGAMYANMPWDNPWKKDDKGNDVLVGNQPNPTWVNTTGSNYMYDLQWNYSKSTAYEFMGNFDFDVKLTDWLKFSSVNNYKYTNYSDMSYTDPRSSGGEESLGSVYNSQNEMYRIYSNQILRFNKQFGKHSINALAAYEWNTYNNKAKSQTGTGIVPNASVADATALAKKVTGTNSEWAVESYIFNTQYAYNSKYFAQVSFRRDGASNFGKNATYGNFFSVSGGWAINQEEFFHADWVENLKLRASFGSVGNRPNSNYPQYGLYSLKSSYNKQPGVLISQVENPDLSWEKSYAFGAGIDFAFLNRFNLTLDYYNKETSGLLYQVPLPSVVGVSSIWRNVGSVRNQGFEATLSSNIIKTKDFKWNVDLNFGLNRNKLIKLYGNQDNMVVSDGSGIAGSANKFLAKGYDVDTWYLTEWAGVDPQTGKAQWYKTDAVTKERVKTFSYGEASKNQVPISHYTPDFFGGFSTNLSWRNIDLSAQFAYSVGGQIYNYARAEYDSDGTYTDRNQMVLLSGWNRWEKPGDIATHPQAMYNNNTNSNRASSRYLEDATYLKLKSVTISYNLAFPQWGINNVRVFASGENLLTFTGYSGVDPEIPPNGYGQITGVASAIYPSTRKYMFGLSVSF